ncbi:prepilin-type N-terminal cleavage/methylation domain-containing protein [Nocardioides sp.]|uniref:prepilin-type N-terminal cleavage/methylation domain-containing protein n=1 Tax=Nocardioides sp. TaxID=35761 RepID=UPI0031FF3ED5|nr:hypothetical protein [Nocardioides sp.]
MTARPSRRAALRGDGGFTLTELLMTMLLVGVLMSFVLATTTRLYGSATDNDVRATSLQQAQIGMDALTKQIRQAVDVAPAEGADPTRFAEATPGRVTLYAATAASAATAVGPRKITFSVQNGRLVQESIEPNAAASNNVYLYTKYPAARNVLTSGLTNPAAMFRYVLDDGTTVDAASDDATRARIRGVEIKLAVLTNPRRKIRPAELQTTVYPFNARSKS